MKGSYWVSLEQLRGDPGFVRRSRREFLEPLPPHDPSPAPAPVKTGADGGDGTSRRDFLKLAGAGVATATAAACTPAPVREAIPFVQHPPELTPGESLHYATTCGACSAACALLVKTRDGRPIKVEGNALAERTGGGTCAVAQGMVLSLYDDGRLTGPRWGGEAVSWEVLDRRLRERLSAVGKAGGRIALVTGGHLGPASRALVREFLNHFPGSTWVPWSPRSAAGIRRACAQGLGHELLPRYRFDRARAVVGLAADFLGTWLSPVEHTRGWVSHRRPDAHGEVSWHGQFETQLSVTGAVADERFPVAASEMGMVALALLARVGERVGWSFDEETRGLLAAVEVHGIEPAALDQAADRLVAERGRALLVSGDSDPAVQRVVLAIQALLDSFGTTVDLDRPAHHDEGDPAHLEELVAAMLRGEVHALLLWGVNPLYDWPRPDELRRALAMVSLTVAMAERLDETAAQVQVVCPPHHFLESWGDAEPVTGELGLRQPTVAPLFDTRAPEDGLLAWMGRGESWYDYLRGHWRQEVFPRQQQSPDFDAFWAQAVHDGVLTLPAPEPAEWGDPRRGDLAGAVRAIASRAAAAREERSAGRLELVLYEKVGIRGGRFAHNPWLRELPDPVSRVAWDHYVALSPATAAELGVGEGDVVDLRLGSEEPVLTLPVLLQPGLASVTAAVAVGYGRAAGGGLEANAFPLVDLDGGVARFHRSGATLAATGRHQALAATQSHHTLEGRDIVREVAVAAWRRDPAAGNRGHGEHPSLWEERKEVQHSWGLAVDLSTCTGCSACVVACQAENNVAVVGRDEVRRGREMHWIRIDRYYGGDPERPDVVFQPMMCQHCDHAPCETVCPVLATVHSSDGLNQQIYNRCIGTRYCANNCPYKVRRFNWFNYAENTRFDFHMNSELGRMVLNPDVAVRSRGVMEKCSLCVQRIQEGKLAAREEGRKVRDGDVQTACQQACPAGAIVFGDYYDEAGRLTALAHDPRHYRVLDELGVRPSVFYLTRLRNRPEDPAAAPHAATHGGGHA
jgi:molybdopterin-containing oxidoreductase family iron-sulfur binding subunit